MKMRVIKYIIALLIVVLIPLSVYGDRSGYSIIAKKKVASPDPCTTMGASGTYSGWWNGEYSGDTDKMCQASGASTVDGTDSGGVIVVGGVINGTYGALLNADAENVRWAAESQTIDTAGTVELTVVVPASLSHDQTLFEIWQDADNFIAVYYHNGTDRFYIWYDGTASGFYYIAAPAEETEVTLMFSWNAATDALALKVGAGAWDIQTSDNIAVFSGVTLYYSIGEDNIARTEGTDGWKVDDVQFREGYEAS